MVIFVIESILLLFEVNCVDEEDDNDVDDVDDDNDDNDDIDVNILIDDDDDEDTINVDDNDDTGSEVDVWLGKTVVNVDGGGVGAHRVGSIQLHGDAQSVKQFWSGPNFEYNWLQQRIFNQLLFFQFF